MDMMQVNTAVRQGAREHGSRRHERPSRRSEWYSSNLQEVLKVGGLFQAHADGCRVRGKVYFTEREDGRKWTNIQVHEFSDETRRVVYKRDIPTVVTLSKEEDGDEAGSGDNRTETFSEKLYLSFARLFGMSKHPGFYPERSRYEKKYSAEVADCIIDLIMDMEEVFSGGAMGNAYFPRPPRQQRH